MNERNGKHWPLLIITLVTMFGDSLLAAWVHMEAYTLKSEKSGSPVPIARSTYFEGYAP
jgi:hypothetical protein